MYLAPSADAAPPSSERLLGVAMIVLGVGLSVATFAMGSSGGILFVGLIGVGVWRLMRSP